MNIASQPLYSPTRHQILIVEDEVLIALNLAMQVEDQGLQVLGPSCTVGSALDLLQYTRPDAALLDVNIGRELVTPVAERLKVLEVPYVLTTACSRHDLPRELAYASMILKPVTSLQLKSALDGLLSVGGEARARARIQELH